ncbi:hypothetical protein [Streptomyces sp. CA-111067]|uniref:hypothetical protein n=1 Tax=Streptomyces sp. CA-111067 TaxID=3240046 RepID=UPI003D96EBBB
MARWEGDPADDRWLEKAAASHLRALQEAVQADRSAFGLYEASCAAGERLAGILDALATEGTASRDALTIRLVTEVGGNGGTLADAAVRRAAAATVDDVLRRKPELDGAMLGQGSGGGLTWDILCDLYQVFFADIVGEFLKATVAEHVKLAAPVLLAVDPEDRVADWVAEKLVDLVPNPCEESAEATELAEAAATAQSVADAVEDPVGALSDMARSLVPRAVGSVLGLISGMAADEEDAA